MEYNTDNVDEYVLALMYLTTFNDRPGNRTWKGYDWGVPDRLHEKGHIGNPARKSKSVIISDEATKLSRELFFKYFGSSEP